MKNMAVLAAAAATGLLFAGSAFGQTTPSTPGNPSCDASGADCDPDTGLGPQVIPAPDEAPLDSSPSDSSSGTDSPSPDAGGSDSGSSGGLSND